MFRRVKAWDRSLPSPGPGIAPKFSQEAVRGTRVRDRDGGTGTSMTGRMAAAAGERSIVEYRQTHTGFGRPCGCVGRAPASARRGESELAQKVGGFQTDQRGGGRGDFCIPVVPPSWVSVPGYRLLLVTSLFAEDPAVSALLEPRRT